MSDVQRFSQDKKVHVRMESSWGATEPEFKTMRFTAWASKERQRGGFEIYDTDGSEQYYAEGGLWFRDNMLCDYDGIYSLPIEIQLWLDEIGMISQNEKDYHRRDIVKHFDRAEVKA
jgi:hypothetical protein